MFKKLTILLISAAVAAAALTSCGDGKAPAEESTKAYSTVADIGKAVRTGLGEDYRASLEIDSEVLDAMFGVKAEWVADYFGEMAEIGNDNDRFILVKASDGHSADVKAAFDDYMEFDFNAERQYPQNIQKTKAAQIYQNGDFVALIITGPVDQNADDSTNYTNALNSNLKAVSIIEEYIGKK